MDLNLAFKIGTFPLFIPRDHDPYTTYKNSVRNITPTSLIKLLSSYKLCTGVENKTAKKSSTPYTVPHNIKHSNLSLNQPNIYFPPDFATFSLKIRNNVKSGKNLATPVFPRQTKFPRDSQ